MKKHIQIHSIFIALALPLSVFAAPPNDNPGEKKPGKTDEPREKAEHNKFMGAITAVNRADKTVTIKDAKMGEHKLHIGDTTKLVRGDKTATWDDLTVGTEVEGTCSKHKDMFHAETLTIKK